MGRASYGGGILIGLAAGLFAGLAFGVLFAPRSGKETSALVRQQIQKLGDRAAGIVYDARDYVAEHVKGEPNYSSAGDI